MSSDKNQKTLFLIRGLPGSGKTFLANVICACNFSADDYFTSRDGSYNFDPTELHRAHAVCFENVRRAMMDKAQKICVHNTFTKNSELRIYISLAAEHGYSVFCLMCENQWQNTHGVSEGGIRSMLRRWEAYIPQR